MQEKDIVRVTQLFSRYMKRFGMAPVFSVEEARHQFLSGSGTGDLGSGGPGRREGQVTWSYVVEVCVSPFWSSYDSNLVFIIRTRKRRKLPTFSRFITCLQRSSITLSTRFWRRLIYITTQRTQVLSLMKTKTKG
jgi:glycylpeptide N-tetradecanoyltransferase